MLDANGRRVEIGDTVATPYPHLADLDNATAELVAALPAMIQGAVLGKVVEIFEGFRGELVHLGDGIIYRSEDIVTLNGLEWVTCEECGKSWPFDVRMNAEEECPFCGALMGHPDLDWELDENLHNAELERAATREALDGCHLDLA